MYKGIGAVERGLQGLSRWVGRLGVCGVGGWWWWRRCGDNVAQQGCPCKSLPLVNVVKCKQAHPSRPVQCREGQ